MPNSIRTLLACTGEYIALCEGDDYWTDPRKLHKQVAFLDSHPDFAGATHQSMIIVENRPVRMFREGVPEALSVTDLIGGRLFHTASVMFRRPVLDLFRRSPLVLSCDRLLNLCMSFVGKIYYSEECMCAYRIHGGGMSSNASVAQMRLDLDCIPYLSQLRPDFPALRYRSYVYATIGFCKSASLLQKVHYLSMSFLLSFADFPKNLVFIASRLGRLASSRIFGR